MVEGLTSKMNFAFKTEIKGVRFGVVKERTAEGIDYGKSRVYQFIGAEMPVEIIGPRRSEIINQYREGVASEAA